MISGATRGGGGKALGRHLASSDHNEDVILNESRGLFSEGIEDQIDELTGMASHARTNTPLYHVHLDPPEGKPLTEDERFEYWEAFEKEFKLENRPFSSVSHIKKGREHEHRVYLAIQSNGKAIRFDFDYARREKLNRIFEVQRGEEIVKGAHNRAVISALEKEGKPELAQRLRDAGIDQGPKPIASLTPQDRNQQERTGVDKSDVSKAVLSAWKQSDNGQAFAMALQEQGLTLAQGTKCPIVVDLSGNSHSLQRMLNMATKAERSDTIPISAISERLTGVDVPSLASAREAMKAPNTLVKSGENTGGHQQPDHPTEAPAVSGGGGGGGGGHVAETTPPAGGSADNETIEGPGEPPGANATPDEKARYRQKLADYDQKKAQQAESARRALSQPKPTTQQGGGSRGPTKEQQDAIREASARLIANLFGESQADNSRLERDQAGDNGRIAEGERNESPDGKRPEGIERGSIQRNHVSSEQRESFATVGPIGADRERVEYQPNDFGPLGGAGRSNQPHGSEIDHSRVETRRFARTVSDTLTEKQESRFRRIIDRLRERKSPESLAQERIEIRRSAMAPILGGKPWPEPRDLDRNLLAEKMRRNANDAITGRRSRIETLKTQAETARKAIPWWHSFVPKKTDAEKLAIELQKSAEFQEQNFEKLNYGDRQKILAASDTAGRIVWQRNRDNQKWESKPEVAKATEEERLLMKVSTSVAFGDERIIGHLLDGRVDLAMQEEAKREKAEQLQLGRQQDSAMASIGESRSPKR